MEELASFLPPYGMISTTTAGAIRALGLDVVPTSGLGSHATVVIPEEWMIDDADALSRTFQRVSNPAKRRTWMATIYADLNAQTTAGRIRLDSRASIESLSVTGAKPGDWVWLEDEDLRVGALIERSNGSVVALPAWDTAEEIIPDGGVPEEECLRAKAELQALVTGEQFPIRRIFELLAKARRLLPAGFDHYLRAQTLFKERHLDLALLAIEAAIKCSPDRPTYRWYRLKIAEQLDLSKALSFANDELRSLKSIVFPTVA